MSGHHFTVVFKDGTAKVGWAESMDSIVLLLGGFDEMHTNVERLFRSGNDYNQFECDLPTKPYASWGTPPATARYLVGSGAGRQIEQPFTRWAD